MNAYERDEVISDIGHDIYLFLYDQEFSEVRGLIAEAGGHSWGLDTLEELETWQNDEEDLIGFQGEIVFSGEEFEDKYMPFRSIRAKILGHAYWQNDKWVIRDY